MLTDRRSPREWEALPRDAMLVALACEERGEAMNGRHHFSCATHTLPLTDDPT